MYDKFSRTDKTIMFAFQRVLSKKAYEDIGISDICAEADIQRMTFYNHFENKDRLFQIILNERQNEAIKLAQEKAKDNSFGAFVDAFLDIVFNTLENDYEKIKFFITANENTPNNAIMIKNSVANTFKKIYKLYADKIKTKIDVRIATIINAESLPKLFKYWIKKEIDLDKAEMKTTIKHILFSNLSEYEIAKEEGISR